MRRQLLSASAAGGRHCYNATPFREPCLWKCAVGPSVRLSICSVPVQAHKFRMKGHGNVKIFAEIFAVTCIIHTIFGEKGQRSRSRKAQISDRTVVTPSESTNINAHPVQNRYCS